MNPNGPEPAKIRPAAVAGRFYPSHAVELRRLILSLLENCPPSGRPPPKALIAPHAGYIYSGPVAASAYSLWQAARDATKRIVIAGPSHFVGFAGLAVSSAEAFETPLGFAAVDLEAVREARSLPQVQVLDEAHELEHALEVQLPFLQVVLPEFKIVPLVVGSAGPDEVAEVLGLFWEDPQTRFVVSSDLSHFLHSDDARALDERTARAIEGLEPDRIAEDQACGRMPIRGLLRAAAQRGLRGRIVDLRNSGDTAGSRHRVVGYGAFAFEEKL
ncbi:MAG TPA: AmmeMemoRadiSam system protein B [Verrucomicrobiae bacterium]